MADCEWYSHLTNFGFNASGLVASVVTLCIETPFVAPIAVAVFAFGLAVRALYIPSSRQLRRLSLATRSPLFTSFADVNTGLALFRSFNAVEPMREYYTQYMIDLQRSMYITKAIQQ